MLETAGSNPVTSAQIYNLSTCVKSRGRQRIGVTCRFFQYFFNVAQHCFISSYPAFLNLFVKNFASEFYRGGLRLAAITLYF